MALPIIIQNWGKSILDIGYMGITGLFLFIHLPAQSRTGLSRQFLPLF